MVNFAEMKGVEILKPGTFADMYGFVFSVTEEDLKAYADSYNPEFLKSALNVDHWNNGPAYGFIDRLYVEGEGDDARLKADLVDIPDDFHEEIVNEKRWAYVSAELADYDINDDGNFVPYVAGLAILGAARPSVKGLPTITTMGEKVRNVVMLSSPLHDPPDKTVKFKAVKYEATGKTDPETSWDASAAIARIKEWASNDADEIDYEKYARAFAWMDPDKADTQGGYKLPHHDVVDGELEVNLKGIQAAMGALMGARGGVDIPADEKKTIHGHLAKHYKQFEKDPPEFKAGEGEETVDKKVEAPTASSHKQSQDKEEIHMSETVTELSEKDLKELQAKARNYDEAQEEARTLRTELRETQGKLSEEKRVSQIVTDEKMRAEIHNFVESAVKDGRFTPASAGLYEAILFSARKAVDVGDAPKIKLAEGQEVDMFEALQILAGALPSGLLKLHEKVIPVIGGDVGPEKPKLVNAEGEIDRKACGEEAQRRVDAALKESKEGVAVDLGQVFLKVLAEADKEAKKL